MAKIRVYELARELNLTNKALLDKLKTINIEVRSHMSSLDKDTVNKIKSNIYGTSKNHNEKRVRSTVIRRRKKVEREDTVQTGPPPEPKKEKTAIQETTITKSDAKKEENLDLEKNSLKDENLKKPEKKNRSTKKKGASEAAKIIRKIPDLQIHKTQTQKDSENKADASNFEQQKQVKTNKPEQNDIKQEKSVDNQVNNKKRSTSKKNTIDKQNENLDKTQQKTINKQTDNVVNNFKQDQPSTKEAKRSKSKKKKKKYSAAKIIKLPDPVSQEISEEITEKAESEKKNKKRNNDTYAPTKPYVENLSNTNNNNDVETSHKKIGKQSDLEQEKKPSRIKKGKRKSVIDGKSLYSDNRKRRSRKEAKGQKAAPVGQKTMITTPKAIKRRIKIDETIVLSDLAKRMGIKANEMIQKLMTLGVMATVNQTIDFDTAVLVAAEFDYELEKASFEEDIILHAGDKDEKPEERIMRPPVVTIMGHVDHGKTSLLDVIRQSRVTDVEAGGITQHIGAYNVTTPNGQIVFLDTPGHEAFTAMRSRGAQVTDIVVLVVAADDGVMPQTIEAINHSKAANVPIIVAINKIDKEDADLDRVKRELSDHGIMSEEWGGESIFVNVSAKKKIGIEDLLEMILLQAEVLELKANPSKLATGYVIESKLDSGRGPVATVLVQEGTLHAGDPVVCGVYSGKIRAMINDTGIFVSKAGPSIPVEILGLGGVPNSGDELVTLADEKSAKQVSSHRIQKQRAKELAKSSRISLEGLFEKMQHEEVKDLNLIIKADVHGSIEALKDSLSKLSGDEVKINIVHSATGTVTESDISLATVSDAIIIGFNVRPAPKVHELAYEENVDMRFYDIIYNAIKDIKGAMVGMMESTFIEHILGRAEVRETFVIPKKGTIAGCFVTDGKIERGQNVRLLREGIIICDGKINSLKRYKDDVKEVQNGYECGIGLENYNDIKIGDHIECYYFEEIKPQMD